MNERTNEWEYKQWFDFYWNYRVDVREIRLINKMLSNIGNKNVNYALLYDSQSCRTAYMSDNYNSCPADLLVDGPVVDAASRPKDITQDLETIVVPAI